MTTSLNSIIDLSNFIESNPDLFIITGAGVSHSSGIPTYRDDVGNWKSYNPIQHSAFLENESVRKRYWARSFIGWPNIAFAKPNQAHYSLVDLETKGYIGTLVTQNVDRLHQRAGHHNVVDLHGRLDQVICMDCGKLTCRQELQKWLQDNNTQFKERDTMPVVLLPDGDAEIEGEIAKGMKVPTCFRCSGLLKPNVVFYGSTVKKQVVQKLNERLLQADALLVIGTSLMVYSSFRFCKLAFENNIPIISINQGLTRADELFSLKVVAECSDTLSKLGRLLIKQV
ncbi:MAG: NAD-dependent protein deacetylase [Gammaproteobacteria bacterium]|nr:NAD-dependent protein deacetylase [Gammaproteobacteria bacterium]